MVSRRTSVYVYLRFQTCKSVSASLRERPLIRSPPRFFTYGPQVPTALCNGPSCAELQGDWIVDVLEHIRKTNYHSIDASEEASNNWAECVAAIADMSLLPTARSVSIL